MSRRHGDMPNLRQAQIRHVPGGFSYIEVLAATVLLAIALVPALEALQVGMHGADVHREATEEHYHVAGKMEEVLAEPFDQLVAAAAAAGAPTVPTSYSEAPATFRRRLVYLSKYDGDDADADNDPFTGVDDDLVWVRVEIENTAQALETLSVR